MTVYQLTVSMWDQTDTLGVFSSVEKAKAAAGECGYVKWEEDKDNPGAWSSDGALWTAYIEPYELDVLTTDEFSLLRVKEQTVYPG